VFSRGVTTLPQKALRGGIQLRYWSCCLVFGQFLAASAHVSQKEILEKMLLFEDMKGLAWCRLLTRCDHPAQKNGT
jgi:hypothetical protein